LNASKKDDRKSRTPDQENGANSKKRNFDKRKTRSGKLFFVKN
jgi:hypothetical protein